MSFLKVVIIIYAIINIVGGIIVQGDWIFQNLAFLVLMLSDYSYDFLDRKKKEVRE